MLLLNVVRRNGGFGGPSGFQLAFVNVGFKESKVTREQTKAV